MKYPKFEITKADREYMRSIGQKPKIIAVKHSEPKKSPAHAALSASIGTSHYSKKQYKHE